MLIATYDYWGYYNVCFLGDEVKDPGKTIPRALLLSILLVRLSIRVDEHQHPGRRALAGNHATPASPIAACMWFPFSCSGSTAPGPRTWLLPW